jgi:flagellar biosynthesis protein FliR
MNDETFKIAPVFVLVFFRVAGMMIFAPLFGSHRIPKRVRALLALVIAFSMVNAVKTPVNFPPTAWQTAVAIGGEMMFGLAIGMILSFVFIAVQWAGEIIGQQMGLNIGSVLDPQYGSQGSVVSDAYFMLLLVIFLMVRGHHALLSGLHDSFEALPLLTVGINRGLFDNIIGLFHASTILAVQLAAPMLVTILIVDVALGFIGKTVPQMNVMTAGMTLRSLIGMIVLIVGLVLSSQVMTGAVRSGMDSVRLAWTTPN